MRALLTLHKAFKCFPKGWVSFAMAFQMVFFAYQAIEFVGITTSETANPRKVLPKAIKGNSGSYCNLLCRSAHCHYGYLSVAEAPS